MKAPATLRARLLLNTLAVLALGMGLAALLAWQAVEAMYLENQRENLLAQASLTAAALQGQPLPENPSQPYLQSSNVLPGIHTRLLAQQGAVVLNLPLSQPYTPPAEPSAPLTPQELMARPEIAQATQGQPATAVRSVSGRRVLYAAAPIQGQDGSLSGLVYLAMPLPASGIPLQMALQLAGAVLLAGALALLAGTLLARRITAPLEGVARAAAAVSAGDLAQRVPAACGIRELDALGQSFNAMTGSLRQSDQAKSAFIADVTHELRTPLTVIKGTIETLQDGALDDLAGRAPLLDSMQRETERLIRLVNDLLLLARADAGTLQVELQPLDLAELARERCQRLAPLAARRQVRLDVTGTEPAPVTGDPDRLAQVLDNLLDNAMRYSPPGGMVAVELSAGGGEVRCAVRDQGAGIAAEHLPFIFDRFYRADSSRNRQTGGVGLGLAIVKALVAAQGGSVSAHSAPGEGTLMMFTCPAPAFKLTHS